MNKERTVLLADAGMIQQWLGLSDSQMERYFTGGKLDRHVETVGAHGSHVHLFDASQRWLAREGLDSLRNVLVIIGGHTPDRSDQRADTLALIDMGATRFQSTI